MKRISLAILALVCAATSATAAEEKVLNVYNWADYIGETTVADFEKEYGIKVNYDTFDGYETLDAKLLAGHTGYDIVFPSNLYFANQIKSGVYRKLDKSKLSNYGNLDPEIVAEFAKFDPGNEYAVPYMWGTNGFTYNVAMIKKRMPDAPTDSLDMLFEPEVISKFADCGVTFLDSPQDVFQLALNYLGLDPNTQKVEDLKPVEAMLAKIRPYIRTFDSATYLNALPAGDVCMAMTWSGDYAVARTRVEEAGADVDLNYTVPKEGANIWFDAMLIPSDAPHPENAQLFMNYVLRPEVAASITNYIGYANANKASLAQVDASLRDDPRIYPTSATRAKLFPQQPESQEMTRARTRAWQRFKTGE